MSSFRKRALDEFASHRPERFFVENQPVSEYFGQNVFDVEKMRRYLSAEAFDAVQSAINEGIRIEREIANQIASGMKAWAVERVQHTTHTGFIRLQTQLRKSTKLLLTRQKTEAYLKISGETRLYSRNRMPQVFLTEVLEIHLKPEDIQHGIQHLQHL